MSARPGDPTAPCGTECEEALGGRGRRGSQEQAQHRGRGRGDRSAQEGWDYVQGTLPVPRRKDRVVRGDAGPRDVEVFRLRARWRHLQLRDAARWGHVSGGAAYAGGQGRRRDRRAHPARRRAESAAAGRARDGHRLLPRGTGRFEDRRAGSRLPSRSRLHRRDDRAPPARLGAARLGHDVENAPVEAADPARRAC